MKTHNKALLVALATTVVATGSAHAVMITPVAVSATSWYDDGSVAVPPENLINGSNFNDTGDPLTSTHGASQLASGMWHAASGQGTTGSAVVDDQELIFDLGGAYDLTGAFIWQMNQNFNFATLARGVDEFEILVSTDGGSNFASVGTFNLDIPSNTAVEPVQVKSFASTAFGVTHVQFNINSALSGNPSENVGLSEVRFQAVPEPASALLLASLGSLLMRRRQR